MQVTVFVSGDTTPEPNEMFTVHLSNASVGASIADADGLGTITNDDGSPTTVYVDDSWVGTTPGTDPDGMGPATSFGFDAFDTIQGGIDGVASDGTVIVYEGNYPQTGTIDVNKSVSLLGPNANNSPNLAAAVNLLQARGPEAVISGNASQSTMRITLAGAQVVIQGFKFDGANVVDCYVADVTAEIRRNIYVNGVGGGAFYFLNSPPSVTIDDNSLTNPSAVDGNDAIFIAGNWNGTTGTAVSITNNVLADPLVGSTGSTGMNLSNVSGSITSNQFSNLHYYAILLANGSGSITISDNTFDGIINPSPASVPTWGAGVRFFQPAFIGSVNIKSNLFENRIAGWVCGGCLTMRARRLRARTFM